MDDLISRKAAINALIAEGRNVDSHYLESERIIHESDAVEVIAMLPSARPEPLTDKEQRIFLAAMGREKKSAKRRTKSAGIAEKHMKIVLCGYARKSRER